MLLKWRTWWNRRSRSGLEILRNGNALRRDHKVYAFLHRGLSNFRRRVCILEAISASITDNDPEESIQNRLEPRDGIEDRSSYWSSNGKRDSAVPETLLYKLTAKSCLVTEVRVQPFQVWDSYISAQAVGVRMGHPKAPVDIESDTR